MKGKRAFSVLAGFLAVLPLVASAQSAADLQAQIAQLSQLIAALKLQIGTQPSGAVPVTTGTIISNLPCTNLTVDLKERYFDIDGPGPISKLQAFLAATGDFDHAVTGYFGPLTTAAVQSWQKRNGIVSAGTPDTTGYGYVGPRTRAAILAVSCPNGVPTRTPTPTPTLPPGQQIPVIVPPVPVQTSQASCSLGSFYIPSGSAVRAYARSAVAPTESCDAYAQTRVCTNGLLSGNPSYAFSTCAVNAVSACVINGLSLANGDSRTFYDVATVTGNDSCVNHGQTRTCTNGVLSGTTAYFVAGCQSVAPSSCSLDGASVQSGTSQTFYSQRVAPYGASCSAYGYARPCVNGSLQGPSNYAYSSCSSATTSSCTVGSVSLASGTSRTFYSSSSVSSGTCAANSSVRTCANGIMDGSDTYSYASCLDSVSSCAFAGTTLANGATTTAYLVQNVAANDSCSYYTTTRTCTNGTLSGNSSYQYASCTAAAAGKCVLDSAVMNSGTSRTFYSAQNAPAGTRCTASALNRTCTNGVLSGSTAYKYATCSDTAACSLDGLTVQNGSAGTFFSTTTVAYGSTCTAVSQSRTCTNGALSGTATYKYSHCSVKPPLSSAGDVASQLAAIAAVLESIRSYLAGSR
jgi:peptidoglycan hydrolase-like protein with peptidoglycan-binding domain